jgi:hypothetical protein
MSGVTSKKRPHSSDYTIQHCSDVTLLSCKDYYVISPLRSLANMALCEIEWNITSIRLAVRKAGSCCLMHVVPNTSQPLVKTLQ